jgi:hypothetical protein
MYTYTLPNLFHKSGFFFEGDIFIKVIIDTTMPKSKYDQITSDVQKLQKIFKNKRR